MLLASIIAIVVGSAVFFFWEMDELPVWSQLSNRLRSNAKRVRKIEQDGKAALKAIQNLHETKKRINDEYREYWDQQYRLLLPPPATPNRQAVRFSYNGKMHKAYRTPHFTWDEKNYILVEPDHTPVPVGAMRRGNKWWYGFNNLPGHSHEVLFIPTDEFDYVENTLFWAFLPTIKELPNGEYTWQESKSKALTTNIKDAVFTTG